MDEIERKTMQDIKNYVKSLDTPDNEVYQQNSLLIMSCFSQAIEFIEQNAKLRQTDSSDSLQDRLFKLANDFAVAKQGEVAVKLHSIHNGLQ